VTVPKEVRAVASTTPVASVAVAVVAGPWTLVGGGAFRERLGYTALEAGAALMLTSGNILSRPTTLEGLGFSLLVGGPLLVLGALLLL